MPHSVRATARRKATNAQANPPGSVVVGKGFVTLEMKRGAGARPRSSAGAGIGGAEGGSRRGRSRPGATGATVTASCGGGNSTGRGGAATAGVPSSAAIASVRTILRPPI